MFELGERQDAFVHFLHATLNFPRAARIVTGVAPGPRPTAWDEVRDHNTGVHLARELDAYLEARSSEAHGFFRSIARHPEVRRMVDELHELRRRWRNDRDQDGRKLLKWVH